MYHYYNVDEGTNFVMPKDEVFEKAVQLLLPDLVQTDPRFEQVVAFAKKDYRKNGKYVTLLADVEGAESASLEMVSRFLRKLGLNSEKREVIVSGHNVLYSRDYRIAPTPVA